VDYATRYPEAVALSGISTEEVAEALCSIYSRVGVPKQVVHDQGSQFMSEVMAEVSRLLSVQNLVSTPYHTQCNGLVKRFNGNEPSDEVRTTYQYVLDLRNRLEDTCQLVKESLSKSSDKAKKHFDRKTRMRELQAGDSVLIMRPTDSSKLLMQWKGPYEVVFTGTFIAKFVIKWLLNIPLHLISASLQYLVKYKICKIH